MSEPEAARPTVAERAALGKAARAAAPRSGLGEWSSAQRTHDPLDLLAEQAKTRVPELVPIRHGRMAASPFAYFRGAALPMAADLSTSPSTRLQVQLCGDAHLSNFGGFGSPERDLLFDVNDFDETHPGPFEWDVKRLAASLEIAARARGFDDKVRRDVVARGIRVYRDTIRAFAGSRYLDAWYARLDAEDIMARWGSAASQQMQTAFRATVSKAIAKDHLKALSKLTQEVNGQLRIVADPPLVVPINDLFPDHTAQAIKDTLADGLHAYRRALQGDRRHLLDRYELVDVARKVVGVGSVGTRAWIGLLVGRDNADPLFLQMKEAEASVLERFTAKSEYRNHGQRVVEGQRLMQAASDIFLGWGQATNPDDGVTRDFYFRQLWYWKASADIDTILPEGLAIYAQLCGWTLARAHARSGDAVALGAYLGSSDTFDRSMLTFASAYANQNADDHAALEAAIAGGKLAAESGV